MRKNTVADFWKKVNKTDGCWEWTGTFIKNGYGHFTMHRKKYLAHRFSVMLDGRDPTGLLVCHKCDNTKCVRPDHLFVGTQQDNVTDMMNKGRHAPGPRKLSNAEVLEIRTSSLSQRKLASMYNVHHCTIFSIIHEINYKDVT